MEAFPPNRELEGGAVVAVAAVALDPNKPPVLVPDEPPPPKSVPDGLGATQPPYSRLLKRKLGHAYL